MNQILLNQRMDLIQENQTKSKKIIGLSKDKSLLLALSVIGAMALGLVTIKKNMSIKIVKDQINKIAKFSKKVSLKNASKTTQKIFNDIKNHTKIVKYGLKVWTGKNKETLNKIAQCLAQ